jgi:hypothetical protein
MIDEEALLLEVEQEERAQQFKIKNQQNNGVSAFSRIFQRDTPGVASSYVAPVLTLHFVTICQVPVVWSKY